MRSEEPAASDADEEALRGLRSELAKRVADREVPNLGLLLSRRGRIVLDAAVGEASVGRPLSSDSILRLYSMSKPLTAAGALILVEQGKLSLEGKVSDYLSCWDDGKVTVKAGDHHVPAARAITIRDLLCHTAGIADYDEVAAQGAHLLPLSSDAAGAMPPTVTSLHEFATRLNALPLVHQPGSAFSYSMSIELLGGVLEEVSGQALGRFLEASLFEPLGMPDTGFEIPEHALGRFTRCYRGTGPNRFEDDAMVGACDASTPWLRGKPQGQRPSGGGGLLSTARDFLRFAEWLATDGRLDGVPALLSRESMAALRSDQLRGMGAGAGPCFDPFQSFGLLGGVVCSPGEGGDYLPAGAASGMGATGWGGVAGTFFAADPEHGLALVLYTQEVNYFLSSQSLRLSLCKQAHGVFPDLRQRLEASQAREASKLMLLLETLHEERIRYGITAETAKADAD
ncbi:hypothetical protein EMIHUDRAFT_252014 [Emiliania huxleyi CCMP1516]|uniref:Beta-lactamase-related domain-containing protein n=2 Tax=Emiliania huxleyi TaxID=2903 RepID=A0A0D3KPM7_EMIH1|nr:hypothetical protein EMIHUDRAFT_252014 [Emiliania huxleyi CCMP1516]EOD37712.1 hypothetical protein EMIHUDRAFT_252014 [Emiliania huxleyi CCMP1516]|eukprot:XP_005790141.1 hypothetical protein EMIHUDRAFT_252014 [Emiliania huxleyi CCMP1516]